MTYEHTKRGWRRALSTVLCVLLVMTSLPLVMFGTAPGAKAYSTFSKPYLTEYYYASGTQFIESLCVGWDGDKMSTISSQMRNAGWTPVSNFTDMMAGWGSKADYIGVGYKTTTDPTNALTDIEFWDSDNGHNNYRYHNNQGSWPGDHTATDTCNGTSATGVKDANTGIVFFRVGGSPMTAYSRDGIVDFFRDFGSGYGNEYLCATKNRAAGAAITAVNCFSGTSSGWTMATCLARGCGAHSSAHGKSTRYVGYQRLTTTVNSDTLRSNNSALLAKYNQISYYTYPSTTKANIEAALNTAQSILSDLNDGYTTSNQTAINNAANACATQSGYMSVIAPRIVRGTWVRDGASGYYVYVYADNNGGAPLSRVQFPSWTNLNNQDDIQSNWPSNSAASGTSGSWTVGGSTYNYRYYVAVSSHNGEYVGYNTHVYAYNTMGSSVCGYTMSMNFDYTVTYSGNGATGGSTANQTVNYGAQTAINNNGFTRAYTVTYNYNGNGQANSSTTASYSFAGWSGSTSSPGYLVNDATERSGTGGANGYTDFA
ncbi:MAG: hypothetical protein K6G71_05170, partial [Clostridiales bacterium]|nr:hypothetical protein [Clostridiales bacterium]